MLTKEEIQNLRDEMDDTMMDWMIDACSDPFFGREDESATIAEVAHDTACDIITRALHTKCPTLPIERRRKLIDAFLPQLLP